MNDSRLRQLLMHADEAGSSGIAMSLDSIFAAASALAERTRRRRMVTVRLAVLVSSMGFVTWSTVSSFNNSVREALPLPVAWQDQKERLDSEIAACEQELSQIESFAARRHIDQERERLLATRFNRASRLDARDEAASIMLTTADRQRDRFGDPSASLAEYRKVVAMFPDTPQARRAEAMLESQPK